MTAETQTPQTAQTAQTADNDSALMAWFDAEVARFEAQGFPRDKATLKALGFLVDNDDEKREAMWEDFGDEPVEY